MEYVDYQVGTPTQGRSISGAVELIREIAFAPSSDDFDAAFVEPRALLSNVKDVLSDGADWIFSNGNSTDQDTVNAAIAIIDAALAKGFVFADQITK